MTITNIKNTERVDTTDITNVTNIEKESVVEVGQDMNLEHCVTFLGMIQDVTIHHIVGNDNLFSNIIN